jgi:hypothetical protein
LASKPRDLPPLDPEKLSTYALGDRASKVGLPQMARVWDEGSGLAGFLDALPDVLAARDFRSVVAAIASARRADRLVAWGMGAHVIKVGLSPVVIDLIERGVIGALLVNGACLVHDFELAYSGKTSEDVGAVLGAGAFGMARETGTTVNRWIADGVARGLGLAESVGRGIAEGGLPHADKSVLAAAVRAGIPVSAAVAIGTDILHIHAAADGARIGEGAMRDFRLFCRVVAALGGGVYLNVGSAVLLPEVFLKAVSAARNLGHPVADLTTVVLDFLPAYRARVNVAERPTAGVGRGYVLTGHHELLVPLLAAAVRLALGK